MGDNSKYDLNLTTAEDNSFLPVIEKCVLSISSPTFKGGIRKDNYVSDISGTTPMLSLLLHRQTNNCYDYHDSMSRFILTESELIKIEKHRLLNQEQSAVNYQYDLLLTKSTKPHQDVQKTNANRRSFSDNRGFYCELEDDVSEIIDVNDYMNQTFGTQIKHGETPIGSSWNANIYRHPENQEVPAGMHPEDSTVQDHHDNGSSTGLLCLKSALQPTPATTLTFLPTNGLAIPRLSNIKDASRWSVAVDKLRMNDNPTRRQLFQIAAMMALGFVFVTLIVVWVLSPILF